jgi:hypothetical protein
LKFRRGVLADVTLQVLVEHLGGPNRRARFHAFIRGPRALRWAFPGLAIAIAALGPGIAMAVLLAAAAVLWSAPILEANRLERAVFKLCEEVVTELQASRATAVGTGVDTTASPVEAEEREASAGE